MVNPCLRAARESLGYTSRGAFHETCIEEFDCCIGVD